MLKQYIITFFRKINRERFYTFVNIFGLAIGIACTLVIFLFIQDELKYDRFHKNYEKIYRVVNVLDKQGVGEKASSCPFPVGPTMQEEYKGHIKKVVRLFNGQASKHLIQFKEKAFNEKRFFFVDSTFFEIFSYNFIRGNPLTALNLPNSVVITQSTAEKYFGSNNAIGKVLLYEKTIQLIVTGVIEDPPSQSHFHFDMLASMATVKQRSKGQLPKTWVWNPCWTYILLESTQSAEFINNDFPNFINKYYYDAEKKYLSAYLQALQDIHLKSHLDYEIEPNSHEAYIYILSFAAIFILIIASINFMNLTTAQATQRAKEIAIRKVVGAFPRQLLNQFILESIIFSFLSLLLSLAFIEILLPIFNEFLGKQLSIFSFFSLYRILLLLGYTFVIGFLSGIYPAFFLASYQPIKVLKGFKSTPSKFGINFRKTLVIIQFSISIIMIICSLLIYNQIQFVLKTDLGFNKKNIILVPSGNTAILKHYDAFKNDLLQDANIKYVTTIEDIIGVNHNAHEFHPEGLPTTSWTFFPTLVVRHDFIETFDIKIVTGRGFSKKYADDEQNAILINESMVKHLGWKNNENAIGKNFSSLRGNEKVVGVFKDFHISSMRNPLRPMVLNMKETPIEINFYSRYIAIRYVENTEKNIIPFIENTWNNYALDNPFEYLFLENEIKKQYKDDQNLSVVTQYFSLLAILIAGLGLLGLISYIAEQRTKEIGVRKILGASIIQIIKNFSREFMQLLIVSNIISWIVAFLIFNNWSNNFAFQHPFSLSAYLIGTFTSVLYCFIIVAIRIYWTAKNNPINALRYE